jgi:hypothetical protein
MIPHLTKMPYKILSIIVEYINFGDVVNLSHASKDLQFLEREEPICKKVLYISIGQVIRLYLAAKRTKEKLPFCDEAIAARKASSGYASAMRRVAKRYEAIATASPFSVAIVGVADYFKYCGGNLCYILDSMLRILDLHSARHDEVVISLPALLRKVLPESEQDPVGNFQVLHYSEDIASCLYKITTPVPAAYLIVFDIRRIKVPIVRQLQSTEKIFVRHDSRFLYWGIYSENE